MAHPAFTLTGAAFSRTNAALTPVKHENHGDSISNNLDKAFNVTGDGKIITALKLTAGVAVNTVLALAGLVEAVVRHIIYGVALITRNEKFIDFAKTGAHHSTEAFIQAGARIVTQFIDESEKEDGKTIYDKIAKKIEGFYFSTIEDRILETTTVIKTNTQDAIFEDAPKENVEPTRTQSALNTDSGIVHLLTYPNYDELVKLVNSDLFANLLASQKDEKALVVKTSSSVANLENEPTVTEIDPRTEPPFAGLLSYPSYDVARLVKSDFFANLYAPQNSGKTSVIEEAPKKAPSSVKQPGFFTRFFNNLSDMGETLGSSHY